MGVAAGQGLNTSVHPKREPVLVGDLHPAYVERRASHSDMLLRAARHSKEAMAYIKKHQSGFGRADEMILADLDIMGLLPPGMETGVPYKMASSLSSELPDSHPVIAAARRSQEAKLTHAAADKREQKKARLDAHRARLSAQRSR